MKLSLLPFLSLFLISITSLLSCKNFKEPEFKKIENVRLNKLGVNESILNLDILYSNPNNTSLKLKSADGEAWIENNYLGYFKVDTLIEIPAKKEFRLPVQLKVNMGKILKNSLLTLLNPEVVIKVSGKAKVGKGFVFINYPIKYEGKQNFKELLK